MRANSKLTPGQYRDPVLGLVFLTYAENRFEAVRGEVEAKANARNPATIADYKAKSVLYVLNESRLPIWSTYQKAAMSARPPMKRSKPSRQPTLS